MLLLIDNYDSFTYNLVQRFGELDPHLNMEVHRNDKITLDRIAAMNPTHIVISPGPCSPKEAGLSNDILKHFASTIPTFGVCLGHQCIGYSFGGNVIRNVRIMHGKVSPIHHDGRGVFAGMSNPFEATRYHSLVIEKESWSNPDFEVSAWTTEGEIMGVRHKKFPIWGVQFHPESILTESGKQILANFLKLTG